MTTLETADAIWLRQALDAHTLDGLDRVAEAPDRPGGRIDWTVPDVARALAPVTAVLQEQGLPGARLVRAVWFTKDATTNWAVPWHQDRVIAVADRHDQPGFTNWTRKGGIWHCEPPVELFSIMRFIRVHLDDCDSANGTMEIARGSQHEGVVPESRATEVAAAYPVEVCAARRGDIQILPMLVLHRSRAAQSALPRRALRLDFALAALPAPLSWRAP